MTETPKPYAAATTDYLGCEYISLDIEGIEKIAAAGSQGPTDVVYLYAGSPPPPPHVVAGEPVAYLVEWFDNGERRRVQFNKKLEPWVSNCDPTVMPLYAASPPDQMAAGKFSLGDRVRKTKGSSWQGRIVGFYSTELTPIGYAVESEREPGSVQIYPEPALAKLED